MKGSPRYREGQAFIKTRHQPPHIKYPLIGMSFVANTDPYDHKHLNVKPEVYTYVHCIYMYLKCFKFYLLNNQQTVAYKIMLCLSTHPKKQAW